jgi:predicted methyltransferase
MRSCISAIWVLLPCLLFSQTAPKPKTAEEIHKLHQDSKAYIAMLENPERDAEQKPDQVIAPLGLRAGETLADIGAGSGYFSFRFARALGNSGRVYEARSAALRKGRTMNRQADASHDSLSD